MRILLPTIRDPGQIGGTTTHLDMLTRGLDENGHESRVFYLGGAIPRAVGLGGVVWPAGMLNRLHRGWGMVYAAVVRGRLLASAVERELARALAAGEPWDVLNAQEVYSVPSLRAVADRYDIPLVLTLHGYPLFESMSEGYTTASPGGRSFLMGSELRALRIADAVITVDSRLHRHVLRLAPERSSTTTSLMNFIDTSSYQPGVEGREELRRAWNVPEGATVLFCPRRLVKKNGVTSPSRALATMTPQQRGRFLLLHAGEGGEREEIERVVREEGLGHEVRLLGGQDRDAILQLYRLADIVLVPSVHSENVEEATSLSALEAMACGRPLIAGAVGGLAEMVEDGKNGLLVPAAEPSALAAAIMRLADDPDLGIRLAHEARTYVVLNHSHLHAASRFVDVYGKAAARQGSDQMPSELGGPRPGGPTVDGATPPHAASGGPAQHADAIVAGLPLISVLGSPLHGVGLEEAAAIVLGWARDDTAPVHGDESRLGGRRGSPRVATSFNPELAVKAQRDPLVAEALLAADLRYPDGVGVVWAAGRRGAVGLERVPGIELAERVLEKAAAESLSAYLLGAAPGVAEQAAEALRARMPGLDIVGAHHGYFSATDETAILAGIRDSGAVLLLVALGAPRQELFIHRHLGDLGVRVALGVGGSFDVWSGRVRRAPGWTRTLGVEWLYRLVTDPRRARRQLALPLFAWRALRDVASDYHPPRGSRGR